RTIIMLQFVKRGTSVEPRQFYLCGSLARGMNKNAIEELGRQMELGEDLPNGKGKVQHHAASRRPGDGGDQENAGTLGMDAEACKLFGGRLGLGACGDSQHFAQAR